MSPEQSSSAAKSTLQNKFLNHVRKSRIPVTVFLVNGVKLQGDIIWFDAFSVLLHRDSHSQLIYKHAISTIMPAKPIDLSDEIEGLDEALIEVERRRTPRSKQPVDA